MLAIVIPYYKIAFFEETLASLARQTNKNFNVYIGNDASPDDPKKIIRKFKQEMNITYKSFEKNIGATSLKSQWDRCMTMVQEEEWFILLGDDDYLSSNYIEEFYKHIDEVENRNIHVIRSATQIKDEARNKLLDLNTHPVLESSTDFFYRRFTQSLHSSLSEFIFEMAPYKKYGFRDFPLGWGTDIVGWLELSDFENIYTLNEATAYIRLSDKNISRKGYLDSTKIQVKSLFFSYVLRKHFRKFNKEQRKPLLKIFEDLTFTSNTASFINWWLISKNLLRIKELKAFLIYNKRFIKYKLKQIEPKQI